MDDLTLEEALDELSSAEDFLDYFGIAYDAAVVHVNRLHILQRFHDYIAKAGELPADEAEQKVAYAELLNRAYQDFVESDAITEKVFKVFHMHEPQTTFVPVTAIGIAPKSGELPMAPVSGGCGCGNTGPCHSSEPAASA